MLHSVILKNLFRSSRLLLPALCVMTALLGVVQAAYADATPTMPEVFYGTVTNNGSIVGSGYVVTAQSGSTVLAGTTTDTSGRYGYTGTGFSVTGTNGQNIVFYVNCTQAQTVSYSGGATNLNLSVTGAPTSPPSGCSSGTATTTSSALTISTSSLTGGTTGTGYSQTVSASGGTGVYTFAVVSGNLPGGLTLSSSGTISGTPTATGTFTFTVQVTDSAPATYSKAFSITIGSTTSTLTGSVSASIMGNTSNLSLAGGILSTATTLASADSSVKLSFAANTSFNLLNQTTIVATETTAPTGSDSATSLVAYSFTPSGSVFSPAATMTLKYNAGSVPTGVSESSLYIAYWDGSAWQGLSTTVDTTNKLVSAPVSHFTIFSVRAPAATTTSTTTTTTTTTTPSTTTTTTPSTSPTTTTPATTTTTTTSSPASTPTSAAVQPLSVFDLTVSPQVATAGQQVDITARLVNSGTVGKTDTAVLKINGNIQDQQEVTLEAGKSQIVDFKVTKSDAGTYAVDINGASASFQVQASTGNQDNGTSLPVLGIIFVGGLLVIVFAIILVMRQRSDNY